MNKKKKGIILFDMDNTLLQMNPHCQEGVVLDRNNYIVNFAHNDDEDISKNKTYGVDKRLLRYLETLKEDYILSTNTCWPVEMQIKLFGNSDFPDLFDYYCSGFHYMLYDNNKKDMISDDFIKDVRDNYNKYYSVKGLSHKVTEWFRIEHGDNFKIIQFEDECNGSIHHNISFTVNCLNVDDTEIDNTTPIQLESELNSIKEESEKYSSGDNRIISSTQFNDFTDKIIKAIKSTIEEEFS